MNTVPHHSLECRFCHAPLQHTVLDLGKTPLANSYLSVGADLAAEPSYPLHARVCADCFLVQVESVVPAEAIFSHYAYFSSFSSSWVAHARQFVHAMVERFHLHKQSQVVEVASNDGYLLQHFVKLGIPCVGVEPAANVAEVAVAAGVPTEVCFFGLETAQQLKAKYGAADLIVANNVMAHVPDLNDFVAGFAALLKSTGVLSIEFPHLLKLLSLTQFDTIYHEHYCYFSLLTVEKVMAKHGLKVFDVQTLPTHGGSLRVLASRMDGEPRSEEAGLLAVRADEAAASLDELASYAGFQPRVLAACQALKDFLVQASAAGKTVVAYGAAAKGNTFLNFAKIGLDHIAYVVDKNPAKQGHLLPGSHLPIYAPEKLMETKPDYVVILPWNIADEIALEMAVVRAWGGQFVTAIPEIRVF